LDQRDQDLGGDRREVLRAGGACAARRLRRAGCLGVGARVTSRAAALLAGLALAPAAPRAGPPGGAGRGPPGGGARRRRGGGALGAVRCVGASGEPLRGAAGLLFGLPIDLNRADRDALEVLPGIGPARAAAIVRERARRPFCAVDELERVPGIGSTTRARLAAWVEASPAARCPRP